MSSSATKNFCTTFIILLLFYEVSLADEMSNMSTEI